MGGCFWWIMHREQSVDCPLQVFRRRFDRRRHQVQHTYKISRMRYPIQPASHPSIGSTDFVLRDTRQTALQTATHRSDVDGHRWSQAGSQTDTAQMKSLDDCISECLATESC